MLSFCGYWKEGCYYRQIKVIPRRDLSQRSRHDGEPDDIEPDLHWPDTALDLI